MNRLIWCNWASQDNDELFELLKYLSDIKIERIVEIGFDRGFGLLNWWRIFEPKILIGIDINIDALETKFLEKAGVVAEILHMRSQDEYTRNKVLKLTSGEIDFLFIDGDHTYEAVKMDYIIYSKMVRKGGVIVLHDAGLKLHPGVGVHKVWDEISTENENSKLIHTSGTGYGVIIK